VNNHPKKQIREYSGGFVGRRFYVGFEVKYAASTHLIRLGQSVSVSAAMRPLRDVRVN
jgi:hypothetical protein